MQPEKEPIEVVRLSALDKESQSTHTAPVDFSREEERRLIRKYDFNILPPLVFMYLCNALDKGGYILCVYEALIVPGNVGNAKTGEPALVDR